MSRDRSLAMCLPQSAEASVPPILRRLIGGYLVLLGLATLLAVVAYLLRGHWWRLNERIIVNHYLYYESIAGAVLTGLILAGAWLRVRSRSQDPAVPGDAAMQASWPLILGIAAAAMLLAWLGTQWISLGHSLSADEFLADFDAQILAEGLLVAPVPPDLSPYLHAMQPLYIRGGADGAHWASMYLPVNAAIRALFALAGDAALASPALAAASVVLLHLVGRRLLPGDGESQLVAVLLLASGMQFLLTAMTPYAMTAHLALNLAWLWLALRGRPWSHAAAALVTLAATGLHQIAFHPLFVAPFLALWVLQRRWVLAAWYTAALGAACLFWMSYPALAFPPAADPATGPAAAAVAHGMGADGALAFLHMVWRLVADIRLDSLFWSAPNLLRFAIWQNPFAVPLLLAACLAWRRWPPEVFALAAGLLLTLAFMSFLVPSPGHGRGYRYLHGLLGSTALLGAFGWQALRDRFAVPPASLRTLLLVATAGSLLPLRAVQTRALIEPYVAAEEAIRGSGADLVLVDRDGLWLGIDLVRNDPFLRKRPIVMDLYGLDEAALRDLCRRYRVEVFDGANPAAAGLHRTSQAERPQRGLLRRLGCATPVAPAAQPTGDGR